ncbi:DNA replication and repair protein RecF [Moraxella macacae 0408225]|uniref:DNA replication and repair protein RecF n=1 Tax=Moraxella macacae 0408225 TaxID=1230338 RepID=L2F8I9_9GAMM|nr:DNA replication and repair protein RecF [Moraxella macacae]ELA09215.1 DNA replication and repair protein RecF [Moraxella macacae 0408225]
MKISELHIHCFRNLHNLRFAPGCCNVILGQNGSGKTALLESIYLLSRGKSFRHHQPKHYITHGKKSTTVFAKLHANFETWLLANTSDEQTVAIQKFDDASTQLRHNGQSVFAQSPITALLPTLLIEPANLNSLEHGGQSRRELLDWLVFHVEQKFYPHWLSYQRLLKQRNGLLKQPNTVFYQQQLQAWDWQLSEHAHVIHQYREQILKQWQVHFDTQIQAFLPMYADKLRLRYSPGFDSDQSLADVLARRWQSDKELGYTRLGCHRADVMVLLNLSHNHRDAHKQTLPATDVLSRGEKKLLMMALRLSQLPLLQNVAKMPLVLIDDIGAELDKKALHTLLMGLKQVDSQLFISSLSDDIVPILQDIWQNNVNVFHVEQGNIITKP